MDIVGKKWMCIVPGTDKLYSGEFADYCKAMREEKKCEFYNNTRQKQNKLTVKAKQVLEQLKLDGINPTEKMIEICAGERLCPYEMSTALGSEAKVIIADYYYIFHPNIRDLFLAKIKKELGEIIIIVDEGHNLPGRVRELATQRLTNQMIRRAIKEAKKFNPQLTSDLSRIQDILNSYNSELEQQKESLIDKDDFVEKINQIRDYDELIEDFEFAAELAREKQKQSFIGSIARFLEGWLGPDEGFARIFSLTQTKAQPILCLSYRCLDPSLITRGVIKDSYSTIMMSGTLTPTSMYKDLLGFPEDTDEKIFPSPFDQDNRLSIVVPETTTKFNMRSDAQFERIGDICAEIVNTVPGNSLIIFPSYYLRDSVYKHFSDQCKKTCFLENPAMSKKEKTEMLDKFKEYKKTGAVMLAVFSGSFGEGIDLPGDLLKAVVLVGLPLQVPDLETRELMKYYENEFGKGWDYGYIFPAFNKALQGAGRCIRSETDRGVIVFLDERYAWPSYMRCFPPDYGVKITKMYKERIEEFFGKKKN
ncbi:ATP-dependent DNA helicase [Candidatus Woesearchaeota archaeon]|nr:ATP-dependent DNA helicase [Candidatus Woesearchaeota archaeon]